MNRPRILRSVGPPRPTAIPHSASATGSRRYIRSRLALITAIWTFVGWIASHRRATAKLGQIRTLDFRTQTRGRGMRWTERLRDRLRPGWLRIRRDDDSAA